jgi:hypothetical protein
MHASILPVVSKGNSKPRRFQLDGLSSRSESPFETVLEAVMHQFTFPSLELAAG